MLRRTRRLLPPLLATASLVALALTSTVSASPQAGSAAGSLDRTRLVSAAHPTNAGAIFGWGGSAWDDEFTEPSGQVRPTWHTSPSRQVSLQHGQLTLNTGTSGDVTATATDQSATTGRWEARVRSRQYTAGTPYVVNWELVPVKGSHCGAQSIQLASYSPGDRVANGAVHTLPDNQFSFNKPLDLGTDVYHTYAVEVTATHISWFVDTHVIRTEKRPAALSGVKLRPQFRMQSVPGQQMAQSRMQMDWVRYYTMKRPDKKSIAASEMTAGTYADAC